jgi:hypothetical protein
MSIQISIRDINKSVKINEFILENELINIINSFHEYIKRNYELVVYLYDDDSTNFHQYIFEYMPESKLSSKKWLLNNIIYSIQCNQTQKNMSKLFINLKCILLNEYHKC